MTGERKAVGGQDILVVVNPVGSAVLSGKNRRSAGNTQRILAVRLIKYGTFCGETVQVWSTDDTVTFVTGEVRTVLIC